MKRIASFSTLRWVSLIFIIGAVILTTLQLVTYSRVRSNFPSGLKIAGVPVGGLDRRQAAERLLLVYATPVEIRYRDAAIQIKPSVVGFELDLEGMLVAADLQRINQPFWSGFWEHLWGRPMPVSPVPLRANLSDARLRAYLETEIAPRYDRPPTAPQPVPGSVVFEAGQPGSVLAIDQAVVLISDALRSPTSRLVNLTYSETGAPRPAFQNLQILLRQILQVGQYKGIAEIYIQDLQTRQNIHFVYTPGSDLSLPVDISFSSWSTIKIPVMVSAFRRLDDSVSADTINMMERMVEQSDNDSTDLLASTVIDQQLAPILITEDMKTLGLENTFWGGFFYPGAPMLRRFETPANLRSDINTGPDPYSQTTALDLGMLLEDIYDCSQTGGGSLVAAFPGEITQKECQQMINFMTLNDIPVLLQDGVPGSVQIAHKHGWAQEVSDGLLHTIADAGLLFTPGGNYVMVVFMHDDDQLLFDPVNKLVSDLSRAVYNYYNMPQ